MGAPSMSSDLYPDMIVVDCKPSEICVAYFPDSPKAFHGYVLKDDLNINGQTPQISIYSF